MFPKVVVSKGNRLAVVLQFFGIYMHSVDNIFAILYVYNVFIQSCRIYIHIQI